MEPVGLALNFGTASFSFKSEKQMRDFLTAYCFKDGRGHVFLHHGVQYHEFTELCKDCYHFIPSDLKFTKSKRTAFMNGTRPWENVDTPM